MLSFQFVLTPKEHETIDFRGRRAEQIRTNLVACFAPVLMAFFLFARTREWGMKTFGVGPWLWFVLLTLAIAAAGLIVCLMIVGSWRRKLATTVIKVDADEESIRLYESGIAAEVAWTGVSKIEADRGIVFITPDGGKTFGIPKRVMDGREAEVIRQFEDWMAGIHSPAAMAMEDPPREEEMREVTYRPGIGEIIRANLHRFSMAFYLRKYGLRVFIALVLISGIAGYQLFFSAEAKLAQSDAPPITWGNLLAVLPGPILVCLGVVAYGVWSVSQKGDVTIAMSDEALRLKLGGNSVEFLWDRVRRIDTSGDLLMLDHEEMGPLYVPVRAFGGVAEQRRTVEYVETLWRERRSRTS